MMNPFLLLAIGAGAFLILRRPGSRRPSLANPPRRGTRRNPIDCDERDLAAAKRLSQEFHGNENHILVLNKHERHLPRYVVEAGALDSFDYEPGRGSKRDDAIYEHEAGDRGLLVAKAKAKPILAVNPRTRKPILIPNRSPMRLTDRGFVG